MLPTSPIRPLICRSLLFHTIVTIAIIFFPAIATADTLSETRNRGNVRCGVNPNLVGFSRSNSLGVFSGFDIDFCRAVSSAIFGSPDEVDFIALPTADRFTALINNRIDILSRNTTWTMERNVTIGEYVGVTFYDGQGFMVYENTEIQSALELDNQSICVTRATTTELNVADFFADSELRYRPVFFNDAADAAKAYAEGECSAITTDRSALAAQRAGFAKPEAHLILPEVISKEPLGPVVRNDDVRWENIIRWSRACLINAEELGVTRNNIDSYNKESTPAIRRLLGISKNAGEELGLDTNWCATIIATLGNYGEVYNRHIGLETPAGLDRGINEIWTNGGLIYAAPIR